VNDFAAWRFVDGLDRTLWGYTRAASFTSEAIGEVGQTAPGTFTVHVAVHELKSVSAKALILCVYRYKPRISRRQVRNGQGCGMGSILTTISTVQVHTASIEVGDGVCRSLGFIVY
jgi:hypothetical protein